MYTSNSSLSRVGNDLPTGVIAGVALADSLDSLNNQVPYIEARPGVQFIAQTDASSTYTMGQGSFLSYVGGAYLVNSSGTACVRIVTDTYEFIDSNVSRVVVEFDPDATIWGA
jgi:hypothetical protein